LIQGVHAQSIVFIDLDTVAHLLQDGHWLGPQANSSTIVLRLTGSRPDRLVVRIGRVQSARKMTSCDFQLESPKEHAKPVVRGAIEFSRVPKQTRTKLILHGVADRDLLGALASTETVRGVANEYARQLLSAIVTKLEARALVPAKRPTAFLKVHS
jgi:hypothetical protein